MDVLAFRRYELRSPVGTRNCSRRRQRTASGGDESYSLVVMSATSLMTWMWSAGRLVSREYSRTVATSGAVRMEKILFSVTKDSSHCTRPPNDCRAV